MTVGTDIKAFWNCKLMYYYTSSLEENVCILNLYDAVKMNGHPN